MNYAKAQKQAKKNIEASYPQPKPEALVGGLYGYFACGLVLLVFCAVAGLKIEDFGQATIIVSLAGFALPYFVLKKKHEAYSQALNAEIDRLEKEA